MVRIRNTTNALKHFSQLPLKYTLAPLILVFIPVVLWFSVPSYIAASSAPIVWLSVPNPAVFAVDPVFLVSLASIGALAVIMIVLEAARTPFSLQLAHWVFVYIFFFAAPLVQYKIGVFPWKELTSLNVNVLLYTNLAILLWCLTWIAFRLLQIPVLDRTAIPTGIRVSTLGIWLSLGLALLATVYLLITVGLGSLLTRADDYNASLGISSVGLVIERVFRSLPAAAVAGALLFFRRRNKPLMLRLAVLVVSFGLLMIADFPLGTARYVVGAVFIGVFLTLFGRYLRTGWPLVFLLTVGLLLVFPLLSTMRYVRKPGDVITYLSDFNLLGPSLATGDFDAYSMVAYTIQYVQEGPGITYGKQLAGALLFFVPRSLWPDKPVGSGFTVAVDSGLNFNNVSSSPIAEGLINFGWVGVVLLAFVLCWLFGIADASFRRAMREEDEDSFVGVIYPFWIGLVFFLLRGDMLSATAFVVAFTVSFLPLLVRFPGFVLDPRRLFVQNQAGRIRRGDH